MYIVVGLGNPGLEYEKTRHNVGYMSATFIADDNGIALRNEERKAIVGKGVISGAKSMIALPITYMNLSGDAVVSLVNFYKIDVTSELIIIYDDIDLETGKLRIRKKGSAGTHNGMKDIIKKLGTNEFIRVRVGVGHKPDGWNLADFVLSKFNKDEVPTMEMAVRDVNDAVKFIISDGADAAMNKYN